MAVERSDSETSGQVIWLRKPGPVSGSGRPGTYPPGGQTPVGDLGRYERADDAPDDYRHRMLVNLLAFAFCIFLIVAGVWLFTTIAEMRKNQDCVLSGRRGCTPVDVPQPSRWQGSLSPHHSDFHRRQT